MQRRMHTTLSHTGILTFSGVSICASAAGARSPQPPHFPPPSPFSKSAMTVSAAASRASPTCLRVGGREEKRSRRASHGLKPHRRARE